MVLRVEEVFCKDRKGVRRETMQAQTTTRKPYDFHLQSIGAGQAVADAHRTASCSHLLFEKRFKWALVAFVSHTSFCNRRSRIPVKEVQPSQP